MRRSARACAKQRSTERDTACGVWHVACGAWRAACGVRRVACGVRRVACGVAHRVRVHAATLRAFLRSGGGGGARTASTIWQRCSSCSASATGVFWSSVERRQTVVRSRIAKATVGPSKAST